MKSEFRHHNNIMYSTEKKFTHFKLCNVLKLSQFFFITFNKLFLANEKM